MGSSKLLLLAIMTASLMLPVANSSVPYLEEWGIYELDLETNETRIIYTNPDEIVTIAVNHDESKLALCLNHGEGYDYTELYTMEIDGSGITRLTNNTQWDLYPNWSPDSSEIAFLSWRNSSLDIWRMNADGANQRLIYDSGGHDSDINWRGDKIAFTRDSQIWVMNSDGSDPMRLTDPPRATEWGNAVLPFGDYDPRISPDGATIVFERMVDDSSPHGNYDLFLIDIDGSNERRLTETGWTQGIATWSPDGEDLIYLVSAKGTEGAYDIYRINADGTGMVDLTSDLFSLEFLVHSPVYAPEGSIYFVGQWYGWERKNPTLDLQPSSNSVTLGNDVTITGSISHEIHDIEFVVKTMKPSGVEVISSLESKDGAFSYLVTAHEVGDWIVTVDWVGNAGYEPVSSELAFTVIEDEESGGIPGFSLFSLLLGFVLFIGTHFSYGQTKSDNLDSKLKL